MYGRFAAGVLACLLLALVSAPAHGELGWPRVVESADGVPISYEVHGSGEITLVFIHGWSCDARYWRAQVPYFSRSHRVVVIDLAGHGHSGLARADYTMAAFGEDVRAVIDAVDAGPVILVGHSMGGPVSVAAARLLPDQVLGIIGVDTFQDVSESLTQEEFDAWLTPLREDFATGAAEFVPQMFVEGTDAALRDWIIADMSAAPPAVALSALEQTLTGRLTGDALSAFDGLEAPIVAINADIWPTDIEANRRHIHDFDAVIIEDTDHFLHMAEPLRFNPAMEAVIARMLEAR